MLTQNLAFGDPQESTQPCIRLEAASNKSRLARVQLCINATFPITLEVVVGSWTALQALKRPCHKPNHTRLFLVVDFPQRRGTAETKQLQVTPMGLCWGGDTALCPLLLCIYTSAPKERSRRMGSCSPEPKHMNSARVPFRSQYPFEDLGLQALVSQAIYYNDQWNNIGVVFNSPWRGWALNLMKFNYSINIVQVLISIQ